MTPRRPSTDAGLCSSCAHAKVVESARGSLFLLCRLSLVDTTFRRYPPLPVLACAGYRREPDPGAERDS
jgi:hypothetical protein